jgi:hypothetical protein
MGILDTCYEMNMTEMHLYCGTNLLLALPSPASPPAHVYLAQISNVRQPSRC